VRLLSSIDDMASFEAGDVLVADMTDPDWEPILKRASAVVTNRGGRTCHAAIIARELGIPAVVGATSATRDLADGQEVTVSCAEGDTGRVYEGILDYDVEETTLEALPDIPVRLMMNVGTPAQAFELSRLPHKGVGLARLEFIINRQVGVHPRALLEVSALPDALRDQVLQATAAYASPRESRPSPPRSRPSRSSCGCPTSSRTSTRAFSEASCSSRTRRTRCSATAGLRATSRRSSRSASPSSARPSATSATTWD
jgi:pyruvate,water dikinase